MLMIRQKQVVNYVYRCSSSFSPSSELRRRVMNKELEFDAHQQRVVDEHLERLHAQLRLHRPEKINRSQGGLSTLFSRFWDKKEDKIESKAPRGVYIWGSVGGGKTMLMDLFFQTLNNEKSEKNDNNNNENNDEKDNKEILLSSRRMHYNDFMSEVHSGMTRAKLAAPPRNLKDSRPQPFDPIPIVADQMAKDAHILCLDEFQVTDIADAMILRQLFAHLFDNCGLILVATSNRPPDELYKKGLQRSQFLPFIAKLKERVEVVTLDSGIDYRRRNLASEEELYLVIDEKNVDKTEKIINKRLDTIFKFMASKETASTRPLILRIKGRDVDFAKTCGGILDASFSELCERALWTNDYIKLANTFHTILIRDVPIMNRGSRSEARRFITLIDTLYDHRVRVVVSARADVDKLFSVQETNADADDDARMLTDDLGLSQGDAASVFSGEEELFAFDRTVSRLVEMQSSQYWNQWNTHVLNKQS